MRNRRNRRGFITVIEVMILIVVFSLLASVDLERRRRFRAPAAKRGCVSNMKTIEGAVELYLMEKDVRDGTRIDLARLKADGYLKSEQTCPRGGRYEIMVHRETVNADGTTDIRCDVHGTIDDTISGL